jgi:hypothetical protein
MQVQCNRLCGMVAVLAILAVVGCTHRQLARSTVLTASTVMDIQVPIDILISDVPPAGWYQLGAKRDVPPDACYVGCYGDRYAWVTPEGMPGLARFTLTVLAVVKLKPGEPGRRGLAFTR